MGHYTLEVRTDPGVRGGGVRRYLTFTGSRTESSRISSYRHLDCPESQREEELLLNRKKDHSRVVKSYTILKPL